MGKILSTTADVIEELGGIGAVASLTGRKYGAAAQWPHFSSFPSNTYIVLTDALALKGKSAPASLWGMTQGRETQNTVAAS